MCPQGSVASLHHWIQATCLPSTGWELFSGVQSLNFLLLDRVRLRPTSENLKQGRWMWQQRVLGATAHTSGHHAHGGIHIPCHSLSPISHKEDT